MKLDADILIAGGGLNGCTLALALAQTGMSVTIVEPKPTALLKNPKFDGRGYALSLSSQLMLGAIGVWKSVAENAQPILEIIVSDGRPGQGPSPFILEFDHAEIEEGPMGYMVEDRFLRNALLTEIDANPLINIIDNERVSDHQVDPAGVSATLSNGSTLRSLVLVACDGRSSATAARAGIKRTGWDYGQTSLVCAVEHAQPHNGIAHQFFMPSGPLAILPLPGNQSSIVWTESNAAARVITDLSDRDYLEVLRPRFGDFLGEIKLADARFSYPLSLSLANSFVSERLALVGDAAHAVHPIAGQGLNAGLKDIAALAEVLTMARRRGEDIGRIDVLERYQQWRRFDVATLATATDAFNRLFSNDNDMLRAGRDLGMGLLNKMPGLRRKIIREAAGLTGDRPKLLQGRPL